MKYQTLFVFFLKNCLLHMPGGALRINYFCYSVLFHLHVIVTFNP